MTRKDEHMGQRCRAQTFADDKRAYFSDFYPHPSSWISVDSRLVTGPARECSFEQTVRNESTISCLGTEVLCNYCKEMEKREILNSCFAWTVRNRNVVLMDFEGFALLNHKHVLRAVKRLADGIIFCFMIKYKRPYYS